MDLENFETRGRKPSRAKFPWDEWLDGEIHIIDPSDFDTNIASLKASMYTKAKNVGKRAVTRNLKDGWLAIQFKDKEPIDILDLTGESA